MFDEDAILRIPESCDCVMEGVEEADDESCGQKKSNTTKSVGFSLTFTAI